MRALPARAQMGQWQAQQSTEALLGVQGVAGEALPAQARALGWHYPRRDERSQATVLRCICSPCQATIVRRCSVSGGTRERVLDTSALPVGARRHWLGRPSLFVGPLRQRRGLR